MIVLSVILAAIVFLLCFCYWIQTYSHVAKLANKFPQTQIGPFLPIIGHLWHVSRKPEIIFQQVREMITKCNGDTFVMWGGPFASLHIVRAEDAEIILSHVKHIDKGQIYNVLDRWLRTGLLTSTGKKWHQRRKMLTPAFHYNILQMFIDVFGEHCDNLTKILKEECGKSKTNIIPIITRTTLATICETSMGIKIQQEEKAISSYLEALYKFVDVCIERVICPWLYPDIVYKILPISWRERKFVKYLHNFTSEIIKKRETTYQDQDVTDLESTDNKDKKRLAMLDLLLYAKRHLGEIDDEGIQEEVDTFVFEGHDTTAVGLTFALLLIANHKDVQVKIIEELDEIFGDSKRHATYNDLQNMKYLECCIKESLRLYPSVPFIVRSINEDIHLAKHVAPAGSEVFVHIYNVHRDPKYYPDPEKFDPERFLPGNSKGRHPYAYIPFSAGPRNCIGQKFAMLELKSILSSVLRNFTMDPIDTLQNLNLVVDLVLRVKGPIHIKFKPRYL